MSGVHTTVARTTVQVPAETSANPPIVASALSRAASPTRPWRADGDTPIHAINNGKMSGSSAVATRQLEVAPLPKELGNHSHLPETPLIYVCFTNTTTASAPDCPFFHVKGPGR